MRTRVFTRKGLRRLLPVLAVAGAVSATAVALVGSGTAASAAAPTNTSAPTVNGVLNVGQQLTASPGTWDGSGPFTYAYQWFRCDGACNAITGATQATYTTQMADQGSNLLVQVTAIDSTGTSSTSAASSAQTAVDITNPGIPSAPTSVAGPSILGQTLQGSTLTAYEGQWTGLPAPQFTYLWSRCNPSGGACNPIPGATASTYTLAAQDVATTLRVQITATNAQGVANVDSAATSIVTVPLGPANTALPAITGTATVGQTLTASNGTWSGATPITYAYQWQQCNAQGQSCQPIAGATNQTYVVQSSNAGSTLNVVVKATNADGTASATSAVTAVVGGGGPVGGTIPVSQVSLSQGNRLVVSTVDYTPNVLSSRASFQLQVQIKDVLGHLVSGAEVDLVAVPYGRISPSPTLTTNQNGSATFTMQPTAKFPLKKGFRITVFVRATKPGDSVVAGVTAIRLTSVGINPNL